MGPLPFQAQLQKEKDRLEAMMSHLHMKSSDVALIGAGPITLKEEPEIVRWHEIFPPSTFQFDF